MEKIYAKEGKIFKSKLDGAYLSNVLILGKEDSLSNYEEVDPPVYDDVEDEEVEDDGRRIKDRVY